MIKVNVQEQNNCIKVIEISGHANYAEYGHDIVCAAVSSIATTTINAILSLENTIKFSDDGNVLKISVINNTDTTNKLLNNMINLLKEVERQYKKNINIRTKEIEKC